LCIIMDILTLCLEIETLSKLLFGVFIYSTN
jgi:hypothetical protein